MGTSTDAILFWGVDFGEEPPYPWRDLAFGAAPPHPWRDLEEDEGDDAVEARDWLYRKIGGPDYPTWDETTKTFTPVLQEYWRARDQALRDYFPGGVPEFDIHCSYNYTLHFVTLEGLKYTASRGYPITITPLDLVVMPEHLESFAKLSELLGIEIKGMSWQLCSFWG